jgi:CelD/BcsL family acetyltransferase involved in cellulose biosynthesis
MSAAELSVLPLPSVAPSACAVSVETVCDQQGLLALERPWNDLMDVAAVDHPFLSHEWVRSWWDCFGAGHQLHVLVVKAGAETVAIAPLMLSRSRMFGLVVRRLELIANVQTPRADFIVARRWAREAYRALWSCLLAQRALWDILVLPQVPADSTTLAQLTALAAEQEFQVGAWRRQSDTSPWIRLRGTWESYFAGLARKHRANLRNRIKRLERLGRVDMEAVAAGPEIVPALEAGFALEAAAWKGQEHTAIRCHPELSRFYERLAEAAAQRGWLRLYFLTLDGRRIAFAYMLRFGNTLFLLKPGYDPDYAAYSPSNLLLSMVLRDAFARGVERFDFLGEADGWKLDWAGETRPHSWLFVFPDTRRGRALHFAKFRLLPWLKRRRRRSSSA